MDAVDVYRTFTAGEARRVGVVALEENLLAFGKTGISVEPGLSEKIALGEERARGMACEE